MKESAFVIEKVSHIGTPIGILYTNKEIENVEIFDLIYETKSIIPGEYLHEYAIGAQDNALRIEGKLLGFIHNGQYFEA